MDKLAAALEIDPVELRLLNALAAGRRPPDRPDDHRFDAGRRDDPRRSRARAAGRRGAAARSVAPARRRGQHDARRGCPSRSRVRGRFQEHRLLGGIRRLLRGACRVARTAAAEVHCAAAEVGQGVTGVILQVARTELGIDDVRVAAGQTATVDSAGSASASRMTWMAAGAVRDACRAALEEQSAAPARRSTSNGSTAIRAPRRSIRRPGRSPASARTSPSRPAR